MTQDWSKHPHYKDRNGWCDDADCPICIARFEHGATLGSMLKQISKRLQQDTEKK